MLLRFIFDGSQTSNFSELGSSLVFLFNGPNVFQVFDGSLRHSIHRDQSNRSTGPVHIVRDWELGTDRLSIDTESHHFMWRVVHRRQEALQSQEEAFHFWPSDSR